MGEEFQDQVLSPRLSALPKSLEFLDAANFPKASPHDRSRESPSDRFAARKRKFTERIFCRIVNMLSTCS